MRQVRCHHGWSVLGAIVLNVAALLPSLGCQAGGDVAAVTSAGSPGGGYLFVTFRGEQSPTSEQVFFGLSRDGLRWTTLNDGEPVLVSELGERGVRDPFLLRGHDGSAFFLIATDLSIHRDPDWRRGVTAGSRSVVIWESEDLVRWSGPRLVEVAPPDAGCAWAPEAIFDRERGDYLLSWASTTERDGFSKHRIWAVRTRDFRAFSEPFVYIEGARSVIDTAIVHDEDSGAYHRFTKDEVSKAIVMESSRRLDGGWVVVEGFALGELTGYEGPTCFRLRPTEPGGADAGGRWCLLLDFYSRGEGYQAWVTSDLSSGRFERAEGVSFPFPFRHGSVITLTEEEYERVASAMGR